MFFFCLFPGRIRQKTNEGHKRKKIETKLGRLHLTQIHFVNILLVFHLLFITFGLICFHFGSFVSYSCQYCISRVLLFFKLIILFYTHISVSVILIHLVSFSFSSAFYFFPIGSKRAQKTCDVSHYLPFAHSKSHFGNASSYHSLL